MTSETRFHPEAFSCQKGDKKRYDIIKAEIIADASELLRGDEENNALSDAQILGMTTQNVVLKKYSTPIF